MTIGGPNKDRIGFRYWKHPGPFAQFNGISGAEGRFLGWWAVMSQAAFSYIGTEIVAVSALIFTLSLSSIVSVSRLLPERLKIQDATYQEPSKECIFVSFPGKTLCILD